MQKTELIKLAQELCDENYCYGFDTYAECYGKSEWLEFLEDYEVTTKAKLITALNESAEQYHDQGGNMDAWTDCEKCISEHKKGSPKFECDCNVKPLETEHIYWEYAKRINPFIAIEV